MAIEIQTADRRLRRITVMWTGAAAIVAVAALVFFGRYIARRADALPTPALVAQTRNWIAAALTVSGLCLLLLAGLAARRARQARGEGRWPIRSARVLRDTRVRHGEPALRIARLLEMAAVLAMILAIAAAALGWRLVAAAH
jgi:hypothetical protein